MISVQDGNIYLHTPLVPVALDPCGAIPGYTLLKIYTEDKRMPKDDILLFPLPFLFIYFFSQILPHFTKGQETQELGYARVTACWWQNVFSPCFVQMKDDEGSCVMVGMVNYTL